jgi:hypothetical protein
MVFQILLRRNDFRWFLMVVSRWYVLAIFVPVAPSPTLVIRALSSLVASTRVLVYLPWNTGGGTLAEWLCCACSLGIAANNQNYLRIPFGIYTSVV